MPCPNVTECICPNNACEFHGMCCECVKHHRERGHAPNCVEITAARLAAEQKEGNN